MIKLLFVLLSIFGNIVVLSQEAYCSNRYSNEISDYEICLDKGSIDRLVNNLAVFENEYVISMFLTYDVSKLTSKIDFCFSLDSCDKLNDALIYSYINEFFYESKVEINDLNLLNTNYIGLSLSVRINSKTNSEYDFRIGTKKFKLE